MGQLLTFMARVRKGKRASVVYGVGLDEQTALYTGPDGIGSFQRQADAGNAHVLREDRRNTKYARIEPGQSLIYLNLQRSRLSVPGQTFDFGLGLPGPGVPSTPISVDGALPPNPYAL